MLECTPLSLKPLCIFFFFLLHHYYSFLQKHETTLVIKTKINKMLSRDRYEHGRLFHHTTLISLAIMFFASLVLLILSIYLYNRIADDSLITTNDGA